MGYLRDTDIVQTFNDGLITSNEFMRKMVTWLTTASRDELDELCGTLMSGFKDE